MYLSVRIMRKVLVSSVIVGGRRVRRRASRLGQLRGGRRLQNAAFGCAAFEGAAFGCAAFGWGTAFGGAAFGGAAFGCAAFVAVRLRWGLRR